MKELTTLQQHIADTLQGDAVFSPADPDKRIVVLTQKLGDLESETAQNIEKIGVSVVVITPLGKLPQPQVDALELDVPVVVQISQAPLGNQTDYDALDLVCEVIKLLHGASNGVGTNARRSRLWLTETPFTLVDESPTYHVNLTTPITFVPRRATPAPVSP